MKQDSLFPELDKIEYNDENRVDISTLPSSDFRKNKLSYHNEVSSGNSRKRSYVCRFF